MSSFALEVGDICILHLKFILLLLLLIVNKTGAHGYLRHRSHRREALDLVFTGLELHLRLSLAVGQAWVHLQLVACPGPLLRGLKLGLRLHHELDLLGDLAILVLLPHQLLLLLVAAHCGKLAVGDLLDEPDVEQMRQGSVHGLCVQGLLLELADLALHRFKLLELQTF